MQNRNQYFKTKKDKAMRQLIHNILDNVPLTRLRKYITNSILYRYAYEGGAVGADVIDKMKQIKQIHKSHRVPASNLLIQ